MNFKTLRNFLIASSLLSTPALATISNQNAYVVDQGNGSTTAFNFSFLIPYQSDGVTPAVQVQVYTPASGVLATLTPNLYSITGVGNSSGGTVTYPLTGSPLAAGSELIITRSLAYTQPTAVTNQGFYPHVVEQTADSLEAQIQQLSVAIGSTFRLPSNIQINPFGPPIPSSVLGFDSNNNPIYYPYPLISDQSSNLSDDVLITTYSANPIYVKINTTIGCVTSSGTITLTLPVISSVVLGQFVRVLDLSNYAGVNNIIIQASGPDVILDHSTSSTQYVVSVNNTLTFLVAMSSGWRAISYGY
jgi:hypothetical protein